MSSTVTIKALYDWIWFLKSFFLKKKNEDNFVFFKDKIKSETNPRPEKQTDIIIIIIIIIKEFTKFTGNAMPLRTANLNHLFGRKLQGMIDPGTIKSFLKYWQGFLGRLKT